jgi:hypothetical protein
VINRLAQTANGIEAIWPAARTGVPHSG